MLLFYVNNFFKKKSVKAAKYKHRGRPIVDTLDFVACYTIFDEIRDNGISPSGKPFFDIWYEECEKLLARDGYITDYETIRIGYQTKYFKIIEVHSSDRISQLINIFCVTPLLDYEYSTP